jgi:hypothetical protein
MLKDATAEGHKPYENMWVLKTDDMIPGLTWWWWWWIFFIKDPSTPGRTKQFMILWSTKYTDDIMVMDRKWKVKQLPKWDDGILKFNGMTAAWWFDGKKMYDPLVLEDSDFEVTHNGDDGKLKPMLDGADYRFFGSPDKYTVNVKDSKNDFHFEMRPWNDYLQKHRFSETQLTKKFSTNIMKIYGMRLNGSIAGEEIEGSAYLQRVTVNAPAVPWYWGLVHCGDGSFLDYFDTFVGPQMFRSKEKATSVLDWGDIRLKKSIHFYHKPTDTEYRFSTKAVKVKHKVVNNLPVFDVTGRNKEKEFRLRLKAYSRAHWRFQQPKRWGMKSIFYYNEYPAIVEEFSFKTLDGSLKVRKDDLGETASNFEHSWGKLI